MVHKKGLGEEPRARAKNFAASRIQRAWKISRWRRVGAY